MKRWLVAWIWLLGCVVLVACGGGGDEGGGDEPSTPTDPSTPETPTPTPSTPTYFSTGFMKGGTMSFAQYLIDKGLIYREQGVVTDPYTSIKRHGATVVRLQLNMVAFPTYKGVAIDWAEWNRVVADAKKAKANQLDLVLTLKPDTDEYTASGADHNLLPAVWKGYNETTLATKLYDWVYATLERLAEQDIYPRAVAVGNEVNLGFLKASASDSPDMNRTARLLKRGFEAVEAYAAKYNPQVQKILHIANPASATYGADAAKAAGVPFDLLGVSWYPGYDHSMAAFNNSPKKMAEQIKARYGAELLILETAASFTSGSVDGVWKGDDCNNAYNWPKWGSDAENAANYTPQKQRERLGQLAAEVKEGGGAGVITWGTESLPDNVGKGFYIYPADWGKGSTWENNSYWDFTNGNNLHEGIDWMRDV